jgi:hypothetical protein
MGILDRYILVTKCITILVSLFLKARYILFSALSTLAFKRKPFISVSKSTKSKDIEFKLAGSKRYFGNH